MKFSSVLLLGAALLAPGLFASDLALADGRVFHEAQVLSQSPRTVVIRHSGGLASVEKQLLPEEWRSRYPIDEAAALVAEQHERAASEAARLAAIQAAAAAAENARARQAAVAAGEDAAERTRASAEMLQMQAMWADAARRVERHFRERAGSAIQEASCAAHILEFKPLNGEAGPWLVSGTVTITTYVRRERPRHTEHTSDEGLTTRTYREPSRRLIPDSTETKPFQAIYSAEGGEPTLTVTSS